MALSVSIAMFAYRQFLTSKRSPLSVHLDVFAIVMEFLATKDSSSGPNSAAENCATLTPPRLFARPLTKDCMRLIYYAVYYIQLSTLSVDCGAPDRHIGKWNSLHVMYKTTTRHFMQTKLRTALYAFTVDVETRDWLVS